ncbi:MAG: hypothetical protein R3F48_04865 [Candidatus Zixiibacteriota bacterium]
MPCSNITELIRVVLDEDDRLTDYRLIKRTCGAGVGGEKILINIFRDCAPCEIVDLDIETFVDRYPAEDDLGQFLMLKHFLALQGVLQVYTGGESGGVGEFCTVSGIGHEDGEVIIDAEIAVDAVTDKIQSCGHCGSCGSKKKLVALDEVGGKRRPRRLDAPSIKDDPNIFPV